MESMIAYCGLNCETCPIHIATIETDQKIQAKMRESIANRCSEVYNIQILPEEITDCDGCRTTTGIIFNGCNDCGIQKCATRNKLESCALCYDFPCEVLEQHFIHDPTSKTRLEEIRWQYHF